MKKPEIEPLAKKSKMIRNSLMYALNNNECDNIIEYILYGYDWDHISTKDKCYLYMKINEYVIKNSIDDKHHQKIWLEAIDKLEEETLEIA